MTIVAPRPIEFPYTFPFPTKDTLSLLEDRGISLDVGRIIVSYSLVPRKVMFLGIHNVLYKYGCQPNSLNGEAISNLEKLIKKASETSDLAIVILSPQDSSLSTKEYKEKTFKNYSFSSLIIDSMPQHLIYPKIWIWASDNIHLKINGYIILYFLGGMSLYPCNFLDVKDFLSHSDVDKALKILDEPIGIYPTPLLSPLH